LKHEIRTKNPLQERPGQKGRHKRTAHKRRAPHIRYTMCTPAE